MPLRSRTVASPAKPATPHRLPGTKPLSKASGRTNKTAVALTSIGGVLGLFATGLWDNAMFLTRHRARGERLDAVLDERAWELFQRGAWAWCAMAALTTLWVRGPGRGRKIGWILLGNLVALGIAGSVVEFEFVRGWPLR